MQACGFAEDDIGEWCTVEYNSEGGVPRSFTFIELVGFYVGCI